MQWFLLLESSSGRSYGMCESWYSGHGRCIWDWRAGQRQDWLGNEVPGEERAVGPWCSIGDLSRGGAQSRASEVEVVVGSAPQGEVG